MKNTLNSFKKRSSLLLLGISSIIGLSGKAAAQTSNDTQDIIKTQLQKTTSPEKNDTILFPTDSIKSNNFDFNIKDIAQIISESDDDFGVFLKSMVTKYPFISIENIDISENPMALYKSQGAYIPQKDNVRVYNCFISDPSKGALVQNQMLGPEQLAVQLKNKKDNAPFVIAHEIKHCLDRRSYSRLGMTMSQIIQINIHEEISSRIAELLLRRANKPTEIKKQIAEVYSITATRRMSRADAITYIKRRGMQGGDLTKESDVRSRIGDYGDYLYNDSLDVSDKIDQAEIDAIVKSAIIMMDEHSRQYQTDIPKLFVFDVRTAQKNSASYFTDVENKTPAVGFDAGMHLTYLMDGIDFIKECSPAVRDELLKFTEKMTKTICQSRSVSQIFTDFGHLDSGADLFAERAGFKTFSPLDIENFSKKNIIKTKEKTR